MASIKTSYKLKDSSFDVNLLSRYTLYLQTHLNDLNIAIFDSEHHKCIFFEHYDFGATSMDITLIECLEAIWENHHLLSATLWHKVVFINVNADFVFIPAEHYSEDAAPFYLGLNSKLDVGRNQGFAFEHERLGAVNYFPVNKELTRWLTAKYPGVVLKQLHFNSAFLQGILSLGSATAEHLHIVVHPDLMTIACIDGRQLRFINTFSYAGPADLLYFTLFVLEEIGLSPQQATVHVWGTLPSIEEGVSLLSQYVSKAMLGTRPKVGFAPALDALPAHHAFDLFSANLAL